nr:immunoglobulin light chain junction region [Macaca mulatta]
CLQGTHNPHSF